MPSSSDNDGSVPTEEGKSSGRTSRVSPGLGDPASITELAEKPSQTLKSVLSQSASKEREEKLNWLRQLARWRPTSPSELLRSEKSLLELIKTPYKQHRVRLEPSNNPLFSSKDEREIHTVEFAHPDPSSPPFADYSSKDGVTTIHEANADPYRSDSSERAHSTPLPKDYSEERNPANSVPVLVMLHGYGAAHGFYFRNYDDLAKYFKVYSIDQLGWGASSRPAFTCKDTSETEAWFVDSLEEWRKLMDLKSFVLLGHSFGGYVAARYSIKYPENVKHLVLVGPAGFCAESERMAKFRTTWQGSVANFLWNSNATPQSLVRALGPWGKNLVQGYTSNRFGSRAQGIELDAQESKVFTEYMYHTIAGRSSGENCLKHIFSLGAFARSPLLQSVNDWKVPTSFIYGVDDWMDYHAGVEACSKLPTAGEVFRVPKSGHYVHIDNPQGFLASLLRACQSILPPGSQEIAPKFPPGSYIQIPLTERGSYSESGSGAESTSSESKSTPIHGFHEGERPRNHKEYFSLAKWARDSDEVSPQSLTLHN